MTEQKPLAPLLQHQFNASIWRMEIDEVTDTLAVEVRSEADKQVTFSSLSLITGATNFTDHVTDERWLAGMEAVHDGVLLLHCYKGQGSPEHKGIIAIDAFTSAPLWSSYNYAFDHLTADGIVCYSLSMQPKKLTLLSIDTGQLLRNISAADKPLANSIVLPSITSPQNLPAATLLPGAYGNIVHYQHHNGREIVSLHSFENGVLEQHLYIIDGKQIVYHDLLNSGIQKLQPEAFVLYKSALVYIKNRTELKAVRL